MVENSLDHQKEHTIWAFVNKDYMNQILLNNELMWNSHKDVKTGDIIVIYTTSPQSSMGFIFKAISDPFYNKEIMKKWDRDAIMISNKIEINEPISLQELTEDPVLSKWKPVNRSHFQFQGSHHKMSENQWNALKKLILEKNPELKKPIENLEGITTNMLTETNGQSITNFLNIIRRKYLKARINKERVKGHELSHLFNKEFPDYLKKLANNQLITDNKHHYNTSSGYHAQIFIKRPWIDLYDENIVANGKYDFYVLYQFDEDINRIYLSINLGGDYKRDEFKLKMKNSFNIPKEFMEDLNRAPWWKSTLWGKSYNLKELPPEEELEKDFLNIIKLYNNLINLVYENNLKFIKIISNLFNEFKESYLKSPEGQEHHSGYEKERLEVKTYYNKIKDNPSIFEDTNDPIINYLLPIKRFSVAPAGFNHIKAVRHTDDNLPEFSQTVYELITNLIGNSDRDTQKKLINSFKSGKHEKGIQSAVLSPVLYYLNSEYWYINNKTVITFNFLSKILGDNEKINGLIFDYINNLEKLKSLVNIISQYVPELSDFEVFDSFCHWMCDERLGYYAKDLQKFKMWLVEKGIDEPQKSNKLKDTLELILNMYIKAKEDKLDVTNKNELLNRMSNTFPNYLKELTLDDYEIYSSISDKWHYCPYIALMNPEISDTPNNGIFVNYIFREDMTGAYLSLRQGVSDIFRREYIKDLDLKSKEYRQLLNGINITDFNYEIDLKRIKGNYPPFYEAANIYSKFYPLDKIPSEEELESDLHKMLDLYNSLVKAIQSGPYESFSDFLNYKNFLYTSETIENFLLSLKVKPFVILTGNSGTGKTKIVQLFAEYLQSKNRGNHQIIPVGANWTENRHLLGFYNVITQDYQITPSLELLLKAVDDENNPYLLVLDEMNLSHVERYFADFLSAMESGKNIPLHTNHHNEKELKVPKVLEIPSNVLVVGTVNVDETTYMFSPKVLDRANTIEFATYPAKNYILGEFTDCNFYGNIDYLEDPLSDLNIRGAKLDYLKNDLENVQITAGTDLWTILAEEIHKFQETLAEAGFDFGFRVIDEILRFMYVSWVYENRPEVLANWRRYFDAQIMQKLLPKIHGSQRELDVVLEKLFKLCYPHELENSTWYLQKFDEEYLLYPTSAKKLQWMGKTLQEKRFVSFTN